MGTWTINQIDYTVATVSESIPYGTTIENYEFSGSVKDVKDSSVQGTFKITSSDKGTATEGQVYNGLSWTFTPTTADSNYNTLTGTNGTLTVNAAPTSAPTAAQTAVPTM